MEDAGIAAGSAHRSEADRRINQDHLGDVEIVVVESETHSTSWLVKLGHPAVVFREHTAPDYGEHADTIRVLQWEREHNCADEHGKYLHYIIKHYHKLHNVTVFLHGHHTAWHEPAGFKDVQVAELIERTAKTQRGIEFLRPKTCGSWQLDVAMINDTVWQQYFQRALGDHPPSYGQQGAYLTPCCSQFAVRRDAVLQHPRSFYLHLKELACHSTHTHDDITKYLERVYGLIFAAVRPTRGGYC